MYIVLLSQKPITGVLNAANAIFLQSKLLQLTIYIRNGQSY